MNCFKSINDTRNATFSFDGLVMPEFGTSLGASASDGIRVSTVSHDAPLQGSTVSADGRARYGAKAFGPLKTAGVVLGANGTRVSEAGVDAAGSDVVVLNPAIVDRNGNTRGIPPRKGPPISS